MGFELGFLLSGLAEQPAVIQSLLDKDQRAAAEYAQTQPRNDEPQTTGLAQLLHTVTQPPRLKVSRFTMDLRCETAWSRSRTGAIVVRPLNLGCELATATAASVSARLQLEVEQVPVPPGNVVATRQAF